MRAMIPCKVRWPVPPATVQKFEKISDRDKVTLIMLNWCIINELPPFHVPELGMTAVHTMDQVKNRLRFSKMRRQLDKYSHP